MADTSSPSFRSLNQIVGEMVSTFLSELDRNNVVSGLQSLKPGSPYLAIIGAVAQSQFRNQQQSLDVLDANDVDHAHGDRLDAIGKAESVPRRAATFASGKVNVTDASFTKVYTKVYQGKPAPIPGSTTIYLADGSSFPTSGQVYVGRGTPNYEGPLTYTSVVNSSGFWTMSLSVGTSNFHGLGETVVLAQGGVRTVPAGQVVSTPLGNQGQSSTFSTVNSATLQDGETEVDGVAVVCQSPGVGGNVSAGSVKVASAPAFSGMAVTNPLPISNGLGVEDDDHYRERIRAARRARAKATETAVTGAAYGVRAPDQAATVTVAQYVRRQSLLDQVVIDDGTGYEETDAGVATEVLMNAALGGEDRFYLARGRPVAKAAVVTSTPAPYALSDGSVLTVKVGGRVSYHTFSAAGFRDVTNATAFEVVASVNADYSLPYSARTEASGTEVALFAKAETNEDVQVVSGGANDALGFPTSQVATLRLYRNDLLLNKDGQYAYLTGQPQANWVGMASGDTLIVSVDGTPKQTYYFLDSDFAALGGGVLSVASSNPLSSWAAVINAKVPGVTCTTSGSSLVLTSNLGASSRAGVTVDPTSTLVTKGMFDPLNLSASGADRDYTLERNRGFIELVEPLSVGDTLGAGTTRTRAFLLSSDVSSGYTVSDLATWWFVVDDPSCLQVLHSLSSVTTLNQAWTLPAGGATPLRRFSASSGGSPFAAFSNVQPGDWFILARDLWTSVGGPATYGAFRVAAVDPSGTWFDAEATETGVASGNLNSDPAFQAFKYVFFARTTAPRVFQVKLTAGAYTPATVQSSFATYLTLSPPLGTNDGQAGVTVTNESGKIRVTTNTYGLTGALSLVGQTPDAALLGYVVGTVKNRTTQAASVVSGNTEVGTPVASDVTSLTNYDSGGPRVQPSTLETSMTNGRIVTGAWLHPVSSATDPSRADANAGQWVGGWYVSSPWLYLPAPTQALVSSALAYTDVGPDRYLPVNKFHVGPAGVLNLVFDGDPVSKGFTVAMTRNLSVDASVPYGLTIRLKDADVGTPQPLGVTFGTSFNFAEFALHAHARAKLQVDGDNTTRALFRVKDWRARGSTSACAILGPVQPSQPVAVANWVDTSSVYVSQASGASRGVVFAAAGRLYKQQLAAGTDLVASGFIVTALTRVGGTTVTATVDIATPGATDHGWQVGNTVYLNSALADFPAGYKTLTGRTAGTVTYAEAGANVTDNLPANTWLAWTSTPTDFTLAQALDWFAWLSGSYWSATDAVLRTYASAVVTSKSADPNGIFWIKLGRNISSPAGDGWDTIVSATDFSVFPLSGPPSMANIVSAVNALATSPVTGTLLDTGAGLVSYDYRTPAYPSLSMALADGLLHVAYGTYNALSNNYDLTLKDYPNATLSTVPNDWANETFRLAPTTAANVADYLARGQVTGLAASGASVLTASGGGSVQLASGVAGSGGSVEVAGGTANAVRLTVLGSYTHPTLGGTYAKVSNTSDLDSLTVLSWVSLDNTLPLPKTLNWTSATTVAASAGVVQLGAAGTAWAFSGGNLPTFGGRWVLDKVGKYAHLSFAAHTGYGQVTPVMPSVGDWVRLETGLGTWRESYVANDPAGVATRFHLGAAHVGGAAVTLSDGRLMVVGGSTTVALSGAVGTVDVYDPVQKKWNVNAAGVGVTYTPLPVARNHGAACLLASGKVLFCGGIDAAGVWHNDAYVFDPTGGGGLGSWAATAGSMGSNRSHHTATKVSTGKVVVVGGATAAGTYTKAVDVFDPSTGLFTATVPTSDFHADGYAFLHGNDLVLVVGGAGATNAYEDFDANALLWTQYGTWASAGFANQVRTGFQAVQLSSTTVLVVGGVLNQNVNPTAPWNSFLGECETFNLLSHAKTQVASLNLPRGGHAAAVMSDGRVLVVGGFASTTNTASCSAEVYSPSANTWSHACGPFNATALCPISATSSGVVVGTGGAYFSAGWLPSTVAEAWDPTTLASPAANSGFYQVMGRSAVGLVLENSSAQAGEWGFGLVAFYTYDSVVPGDSFRISSNFLGAGTAGTYSVSSLDLISNTKFTVSTNSLTFSTTTLGSNLPFVSVAPPRGAHLLYEVLGITPDDVNANQFYVRLTDAHRELMSASAGSVLTALDKLNFQTSVASGQDSYRYKTGLVGETNLVVYGDERDPDTYPGFASAQAAFDIVAPLVRRVTLSLAVRRAAGSDDVKTRVQAAAAKVVNTAAPGPIPLSLVTEAVQQVDGVVSVLLLTPAPALGADSISVQPGEKAMVLDPSDVQVSFI